MPIGLAQVLCSASASRGGVSFPESAENDRIAGGGGTLVKVGHGCYIKEEGWVVS